MTLGRYKVSKYIRISLSLRLYFTVYLSSCHNADTVKYWAGKYNTVKHSAMKFRALKLTEVKNMALKYKAETYGAVKYRPDPLIALHLPIPLNWKETDSHKKYQNLEALHRVHL